jgi:hypothetical protein
METAKEKPVAPQNQILVGIQTGQCPICKETKKLLLLKYGFSLCEDCLSVCISVLDYLQKQENQNENPKPPKNQGFFQKKPQLKNFNKNLLEKAIN